MNRIWKSLQNDQAKESGINIVCDGTAELRELVLKRTGSIAFKFIKYI